jgi:hypothetical protein
MRVKLSGSVELMKEIEAAMAAADQATVEVGVRKRENAELGFSLTDVHDLIGSVKDLVELAPILWVAGVALWRKLSGEQALAKADAPAQHTIDITTSLKQVQVTVTPTSTVEQIERQLA